MYIHVRLLTGYSQLLTYAIPTTCKVSIGRGSFVRVPLQNRTVFAVVEACSFRVPEQASTYKIREILAIEQFPDDPYYYDFILALAAYYQTDYIQFVKRIRQFLQDKPSAPSDILVPPMLSHKVELTEQQQAVYNYLAPRIQKPLYSPTLLQGITGSGKTEVYKRLIIDAVALNHTALLLLPEVSLALQFESLLRAQLAPDFPLYGFHSATPSAEKKILWRNLIGQKPMLIIGVHMPILLPIANLGLIIVDEEHESGYQEKKHPRVHTKEAALLRAQKAGIPILLGSATPSISSLYNVHTRNWSLFKLTKRFKGSLPTIQKVDLLSPKKRKRNFWISYELDKAIADRLQKNEQTIIFLNRRGHSFFVQCTGCSFIFMCSNCSVSLTLHDELRLTCHYCGYTLQQPEHCPDCKGSEQHFIKKGIGTQQLVTILQKMFPQARIGRADVDTTSKKKEWARTVVEFKEGALDILIGTQTITKGYHFPGVTLVGIIWADLPLHFPVYNASETSLQQLIQVAGRAGRESSQSLVVVQTMAEHALFEFLDESRYLDFYEQEIESRKQVGYPPCLRFVEIEIIYKNPELVEHETTLFFNALTKAQPVLAPDTLILGPTKSAVHMIKNMHKRVIYLKCVDFAQIVRLFSSIDRTTYKSGIFFTPNPMH